MSATPDEEVPDPGCLPAWKVDELPEPQPFTFKNLLKLVGPGLVLAGGAIGTGELIMGPQVAARYQGALLWVALLSILAQVMLNTEVMRYTLCTGEPIMTGFLRCKPGPKFWIGFYILLEFAGWFPTLAGLSAQVLVVAWLRLGPNDPIPVDTVRLVSYIVFLSCAALSLFGKKIFDTVQVVVTGKLIFLLVCMTACSIFFVSGDTWLRVVGGMVDFTRIPRDASGQPDIDWSIVAGLAGFAGVGGLGNLMVSNFVREKGWGMGSKVGVIASATGDHDLTLQHIGVICRPGPETTRRFAGWFKYLLIDQWLLWATGAIIGVLLPCLLGAQYLKIGNVDGSDQWRWAAALAQDIGAVRGPLVGTVILLCALVILIPGQFYVIDATARKWTDVIWSGTDWARKLDTHKANRVYYSIAAAYVTYGLIAFAIPGLSASKMMVIGGSLANLSIAITMIHALLVNRRFLPRSLHPTPLKQALLILSIAFFLVMFGLVVNQKILPLIGFKTV
ncbi:Nramp family divalent metal transporter [Armatimonas sp.]|uniref:Nramp family divalent metal transporter n=1 Tax=Armatimonas sp. TaxID=1872638 RepID=UPI00286CC3FD|nr:Nramp family divalent metal transporter [Armatimonas sp.]